MQKSFLKYIILVLIAMTYGCKTQEPLISQGQNLSYLYNPGSTSLHPRFMIYHSNSTTTNLMVKVYPVELLFNQANAEGKYQAWLSIRYRSFELGKTRMLVDSSSLEFPLQLEGLKKEFVTNINLKTQPLKKYLVEVVVMDRLRKTAVQTFLSVDRSSEINSQNFMILNHKTRSVIFNPVVDSNMIFDVYFPKKTMDTLYVKYYKPDSRIPYFPNLLLSSPVKLSDPDSTWIMPYWDTEGIRINEKGVYQFSIGEEDETGCNIFYFGQYYPAVKTPDQMIEPLAYLLSDKEMDDMNSQPDKKLAVDNFWLGASDNIDRAKEQIRIYYNRVLYANYYFTSFKEGWRTDRGMIYVIYGPPTGLYKTPTEEKWVYGNEKSTEKISFTFKKVDSPFSYNIYRLSRSADLNSRWVQAVRSWRQGNIYIVGSE